MNVDDLVIMTEFQDALKPLSAAQRDQLEASIREEKKFLNPVLWAKLADGSCCVVDGHNRIDIWDTLVADDLNEVQPPETQEVECLRGASDEQVIEWIKMHQAARRNDEQLVRAVFEIGKEWLESDKTSAEVAAEHGMTESQVRHAGKTAEVLQKAEELSPGTLEKVFEDEGITPGAIRKSTPEEVVKRAHVGAPAEPGPLSHFEPLSKAIAAIRAQAEKASRGLQAAENQTTPCSWSEKITQLIREVHASVDDMEEAVKNWQFGG